MLRTQRIAVLNSGVHSGSKYVQVVGKEDHILGPLGALHKCKHRDTSSLTGQPQSSRHNEHCLFFCFFVLFKVLYRRSGGWHNGGKNEYLYSSHNQIFNFDLGSVFTNLKSLKVCTTSNKISNYEGVMTHFPQQKGL